jgi:chitosanase
MAISLDQKLKIQRIVNVFETGTPVGKYESVTVYKDGPVINGSKTYQVTYGRSQTTEFGNLKRLIELYIGKKGIYSNSFSPYLSKIGKQPSLQSDNTFKNLLKNAAINDQIMKTTQDEFFDIYYYQPAFDWFNGQRFTEALSLLTIYDSFIHSGGVLNFLRQRFSERTPFNGGKEKKWIEQYVQTRFDWLNSNTNSLLRKTAYRPKCFLNQIGLNNWDLSQPVNANGINV